MGSKGKVYLVGAGPGDPGLITAKGLEYLKAADVIIYDYLVNERLLRHARLDCEQIGREKRVPKEQDRINRLMVEKAREGKIIVRLKGGDPFLFGRGGEEAEILAQADVPFEVVPGVTSALAAPAYAGIPLTHRRLSSTVGIFTGHEALDKAGSTVNWDEIGRAVDTLVILMGIKNLPAIVERLLSAGKSESTPVALIRWGTLPQQEVLISTLGKVTEDAQGIEPPAIIVVGEVVRLREEIGWFGKKPLSGRRILAAGEATHLDTLAGLLAEEGAEAEVLPVVCTIPVEDASQLDQTIETLDDYEWLVFTSHKGVRFFWDRLEAAKLDTRQLGTVKVAAIGPSTAASLAKRGIIADLIPECYSTEGLVEAFASLDLNGHRVLLARSDLGNPRLPQGLSAMGALVEQVDIYHTVPAEIAPEKQAEIAERLGRGEIDLIAFTSSSSVRCFVDSFDGSQAPAVACIGPETAGTARQLGLPVQVVAERHTLDGLVKAIAAHDFQGDGS